MERVHEVLVFLQAHERAVTLAELRRGTRLRRATLGAALRELELGGEIAIAGQAVRLLLQPQAPPERPRTRADCVGGLRPCPWVSCAHHLYLDVNRSGTVKLNFPDLEPHELPVSCVLDVADTGETLQTEVGHAMNLSRERVRQIEIVALNKLEDLREVMALREHEGAGPLGVRRLPMAPLRAA